MAASRLSAFELERDAAVDKINALGLKSFAGRGFDVPLIEGCAA